MALHWDVSTVGNGYGIVDKDEEGRGNLHPVTHGLIWATMAVGLGRITEGNAAEFGARLDLWQDLHGAFMSGPDGPVRITREEVLANVGLKCNVSDETRAAWIKRTTADHFRGIPATARKGGK